MGEIARAGTHGFFNGMLSELQGGSFFDSYAAGALGSLGGSVFEHFAKGFAASGIGTVAFSSLSGGVGAALSGGDFWRGAGQGATVSLLNHLAHRAVEGPRPKRKNDNFITGWFKKHINAKVGLSFSVGKQLGIVGNPNGKKGLFYDAGSSIVLNTETSTNRGYPIGSTY